MNDELVGNIVLYVVGAFGFALLFLGMFWIILLLLRSILRVIRSFKNRM